MAVKNLRRRWVTYIPYVVCRRRGVDGECMTAMSNDHRPSMTAADVANNNLRCHADVVLTC